MSDKWWEVPSQASDSMKINLRVRLADEFGPLLDIQYFAICMECKEVWYAKWRPVPMDDIYHDKETSKEFHRSANDDIWQESDPDAQALWVRCLLHLETHPGVLERLGLSVDPATPIHDQGMIARPPL